MSSALNNTLFEKLLLSRHQLYGAISSHLLVQSKKKEEITLL